MSSSGRGIHECKRNQAEQKEAGKVGAQIRREAQNEGVYWICVCVQHSDSQAQVPRKQGVFRLQEKIGRKVVATTGGENAGP